MQNSRVLEIAVGAFVALAIGAFLLLALQVSDISSFGESKGYTVTARFANVGGLKVRSPVTMAGVKIGRVRDIRFDETTFEGVVELHIDARFASLPEDTSASILTSGLLGEQYVGLEAGGSLDSLQAGSQIEFTQSALVLEKIIGQFLFSQASEGAE
jgi:phospholipid/cholesterol/gamma-HCH transport system substrate-binding protein